MEKIKIAILKSKLSEEEKIDILSNIIKLLENHKTYNVNLYAENINEMATWNRTPQGSVYWGAVEAQLEKYY